MSEPRPRVLLVDDEVGILRMFRTALINSGFDIEEARDGHEALARLAEKPFDVLVSDVNMPVCGGLELLRRVRELHADMPVILMTGKPSLESANRALEFGAVRYLVKPVFPVALKEAVDRAIQGYRSRRARGGAANECVCAKCGRTAKGSSAAGGWRSYPDGWFVHEKAGRMACCEACATPAP